MKKFFLLLIVLFCTISLFASVSSKKTGKMVPNPYSKENIARYVTGRPYSNGLLVDDNGGTSYEDNDAFITEDSLQKILEIRKSKSIIASTLSLLTDDTFKIEKAIVFDSLMEQKERYLEDSVSVLKKNKEKNGLGEKENKEMEKLLIIMAVVVLLIFFLRENFLKRMNNR